MKSAIEIRDLVKVFAGELFKKKVRVLNGISITVFQGEVFGFLGLNGAGKTTTIKILMGLNQPTSGTATIFQGNIKKPALRRQVGFLPESPYFYDYLTGVELLSFYGRLFEFEPKTIASKIQTLLKLVDLEEAAHLPLRKFSKGMLQRIGIAQALLNDPTLVVLDEPMSGLDPIGRRDIRDLILRLKGEGKTVFFSSHIISDVQMICDRIAIIHKGVICAEGRIDKLLQKEESLEDFFIKTVSQGGLVRSIEP